MDRMDGVIAADIDRERSAYERSRLEEVPLPGTVRVESEERRPEEPDTSGMVDEEVDPVETCVVEVVMEGLEEPPIWARPVSTCRECRREE